MARVVVDPVTRIEGHMRVEVEVANGKVTDAWVHGTEFRGFEKIVQGKDPRDAVYVTERICGVCAGSHGWASALAVDNAFGANVPAAGRILRNLILGAMFMHDHPLHFYHLSALDYLDVMAIAQYKGSDPRLNAVKERIVHLVEANDTSPLTPRYEPDEFTVSDPELVTLAVHHYIQALEMQAKAKKASAILGGKQPHQAGIIVGGVTQLPTAAQLAEFRSLVLEVGQFVKDVYLQDILTFGTGPLLPLARGGVGAGVLNYLGYPGFEIGPEGGDFFFKGGAVFKENLRKTEELDTGEVTESVAYSRYKDSIGTKHPYEGDTIPDLDKADAYSFVKAPRYKGRPMEVGPLARLVVNQHEGLWGAIEAYNLKPGAVARHLARALETVDIADAMLGWIDDLAGLIGSGKTDIHDTAHWEPVLAGEGFGLTEAPRGALGHWIKVANRQTAHYQIVVPTTWNASPRDEQGQRGPIEEALIGAPVPDPENPTNVVRIIRSFDPCMACAVHIMDPDSNVVREFQLNL